MKRIMSVVGFLVLTALSGSGQQMGAFFPIITASNDTMTESVLDADPPAGMRLIRAGTNIGTDPDFGAYALTNPTAFYMDTTEVTKAKWDEVYAWAVTNGYSFDNAGSGNADDHPVQMISWYDCVKWCNARSEQEGRTPCYWASIDRVYKTGQSSPTCDFGLSGYRLPNMTEWEFAARGKLSGMRFPWGDTITHSQANYNSSNSCDFDTSPTRGCHPTYATGEAPFTSPVGSFAANGYGLYDMAGNVAEFCNDSQDSYRRCCGGSWDNSAIYARCGYYDGWCFPDIANSSFGFRAVCLFRVLTTPSGFGPQMGAFYRIIAPTNTKITALDSQGYMVWTNAATAGVTCIIQRAATLAGPSNWFDYVQHAATNATMAARVHDPNPPAGMVLIPAGMNNGTNPLGVHESYDPGYHSEFNYAQTYSLTVEAFYMDATEVTWAKWKEVCDWAVTNGYDLSGIGMGEAENHPVQCV